MSDSPIAVALVRAAVAPLHGEPRVSTPQTSQALFGFALDVLERRGDWCRVRGLFDGYEGWVHAGYVAIVDADPSRDESVEPPTFVGDPDAEPSPEDDAATIAQLLGDAAPRVSLGCTVRAGDRVLRLPLGALIFDGQEVLDGEAVPVGESAVRFPATRDAIVTSARRFFRGTSYQWGGVTPWGADCSGFVQTLLRLHGVALPRDAWQQAGVGVDAGTAIEALRAGDLLFFSDRDDRRVTHVGLALGDARMAHLALGRGGWAEDDLADVDDPYVAALRRNFLHARRVLRADARR